MPFALLFATVLLCAGYGVLRALRLAKGPTAVGLTPVAGLALLAVATTFVGLIGAPPPVAGLLVSGGALGGVIVAGLDWHALVCVVRGLARVERLAAAVASVAVLVPVIALGAAFAGVQAPLSPHDGAFHVETIQVFRHGSAVAENWYPPGVAALFGGVLQLTPWLDTAAGAYQLGLGLALLAPLVAFGLAVAIWRNLLAASMSALLLSLTYLFPYYPQIWSGWPQTLGLLLVLGLWTVAIEYVQQPRWAYAVLGGLLIGAIVVVHGTELFTSAMLLLATAIGAWRRLPWRTLRLHLPLAMMLAIVCAAVYLPALTHWATAGGAYVAGVNDGLALESSAKSATAADMLGVFTADALGIDLPIRVVLIALGIGRAVRERRGRVLVVVAVVFCALAATFSFFGGVVGVREAYAVAFPWSLPFRQLMFATTPLALLAGGGCLVAAGVWQRVLSRIRGRGAKRRVGRAARLVVVAWGLVATLALTVFLSIPRAALDSFVADDAAAMTWLRANVPAGEVVANDGFADAGIWAPYKAGVAILEYRSRPGPGTDAERQAIIQNIAELDSAPAAAAAACRLGVRFVYYGAANSGWQPRAFPPPEILRASTALEQVFGAGDAAVFRIKLRCQDGG